MEKNSKIYVAGHRGMVGSAVMRCLSKNGYNNLLFRSSKELDLTDQAAVEGFISKEKPEYVFIAAARVGGIYANNTYRAEFIYVNLEIETNLIHASWRSQVKKLLFFSSSCVYPRNCPQPMREEHLWSGFLEPTNQPYAVAKLAGMEMCRAYNDQYGTNYISVIPPNLYGINDNFDPQQSHVVAALIQKFHSAKVSGASEVVLWGSGNPRRELMDVDDAASAALFIMNDYTGEGPINIGWGMDVSVRELASIVARIVDYKGNIAFDKTKPDGIPQKLLDVKKISSLGWQPSIPLEEGIKKAYEWYLDSVIKG
jgi:GDP-L-fucose synthase